MSWFEPPPAPEKPPEPPRRPAWSGPPDSEVGVGLPLRLALVRSQKVAVVIGEFVVYSTGFEVVVSTRLQQAEGFGMPGVFQGHVQPGKPIPPEVFRFGIEFADGRRASSLGRGGSMMRAAADTPPESPLLIGRGGSGGGNRFDSRYWIWPLPPPGPLTFACEWPAYDVPLTTLQVDSAPILEAAPRSEKLWPAGWGGQ